MSNASVTRNSFQSLDWIPVDPTAKKQLLVVSCVTTDHYESIEVLVRLLLNAVILTELYPLSINEGAIESTLIDTLSPFVCYAFLFMNN